jgi:hypothetical protein
LSVIAQTDEVAQPEIIAGGVVLERHGGHLPVWNRDQGPVEGADASGTESNSFDGADDVADLE